MLRSFANFLVHHSFQPKAKTHRAGTGRLKRGTVSKQLLCVTFPMNTTPDLISFKGVKTAAPKAKRARGMGIVTL